MALAPREVTPGPSAGAGDEAQRRRARRTAWALADAAREPFLTIVLSLVFPPFFVAQVAADPVQGTALWGYALTAAALLLLPLAPLAGTLADHSPSRLRWAACCVVATAAAALGLWPASGEGASPWPSLALVVLAYVGVELTRVFTDARIPQLARADGVGALSGIGVGLGFAATLGYLAAIALATELTQGRAEAGVVERLASAGTGLWLGVLFVPFLLAFRAGARPATDVTADAAATAAGGPALLPALAQRLRGALGRLREDGELRRFLLARVVYWDGTMALFSFFTIVASTALGWQTAQLTLFGMLGLAAGAAAGLGAGALDRRFGARGSALLGTVLLLACALALAALASDAAAARASAAGAAGARARDAAFLATGVLASGCLGLIMASSRALLARIAPAQHAGEYFGLYVMIGRAASVLSPLLVAVATTLSGAPRSGVFGVSIALLALGAALLLRVRRC